MVCCVLRGFLFVWACAFLWWGRQTIRVFQEEILIMSGISALACGWEQISAQAVCLLKYLILHYQTHCNAYIKFSREYTEGVWSAQTMGKAWKICRKKKKIKLNPYIARSYCSERRNKSWESNFISIHCTKQWPSSCAACSRTDVICPPWHTGPLRPAHKYWAAASHKSSCISLAKERL